MSEQMNVPMLRFDEFDQEWTSGSLATICNKIQDGNYGAEYPKSEELLEFGIPFLTSKALGGSGIINVSKIDYISKEKHASLKKAQLQLNDVLFTNRGSNVGVISYVDERIAHGNIGPQLTLLRANDLVTPKFLKAYLQTRLFQKQVASQDSGSAMNFFGIKTTSKFKVSVPQITEQQKIASFLSKVDEKIGLLLEKKDKLTEYKRGVMQQLFNGKWHEQDGQLTFIQPTLRFKADDGNEFPDWEEKKLGDFVEINSGYSPSKFEMKASGTPYFKVEQLNNSIKYQDQTQTPTYIEDFDKAVPAGSIIFPKRGASILLNKVRILVHNSFMDTNLMTLTVNSELNNEFLFYFLVKEDLSKIADTTSIPQINNKHINPYPLALPALAEQIKIANFLSAIDQKIDLANSELHKAKEWKKGLLQQMFV